MEFTSKTTGNILKIFLLIGTILSGVLVITTFFFAYFNDFFQSIMKVDQTVSFFYFILWIITLFIYLIWIYKVHKDLRKLNPEYPIKPGGALARVLIPIYNLYGMWNVFSTMVDFFKNHAMTESYAKSLKTLIPFYYILFFVTGTLQRMMNRNLILNEQVIFLTYLLDFFFMISIFLMTKVILDAFSVLKSDNLMESDIDQDENNLKDGTE